MLCIALIIIYLSPINTIWQYHIHQEKYNRKHYLPLNQEGEVWEEVASSKYSVRPPPDLQSRYALIMQEREQRRSSLDTQQQLTEGRMEEGNDDAPVTRKSQVWGWFIVFGW